MFGEKGAGKTALRLQIAAQIDEHNAKNADGRLFVIEYDDFNPFLDRFADRLSSRKRRNAGKVLAEWKLWDHMDAILSLGVTSVVDRLLGATQPSGPAANALPADAAKRLDRFQKRDLLLLAACYDNSLTETFQSRWYRLRRKVGYWPWQSWAIRLLGVAVTAAVAGVILYNKKYEWLKTVWPWLIIALGWAPWLAQTGRWWFRGWRRLAESALGQPRRPTRCGRCSCSSPAATSAASRCPNKQRTDDRYELLYKFQGVLQALGFSGIVVLVDRVDEPHLINGSLEKMQGLVWSMLDNKFLKQPGVGPQAAAADRAGGVRREGRPRLLPAGPARQAEHGAVARVDRPVAVRPGQRPRRGLRRQRRRRRSCATCSTSSISDQRLVDAFAGLRVPRHLFKFLYRMLAAHCQQYTDAVAVVADFAEHVRGAASGLSARPARGRSRLGRDRELSQRSMISRARLLTAGSGLSPRG